ncbi:hypothetical protein BGZ93_003661 [Podila epicladia]|nr:hypothetical protein BGZ92_002075 [Podila epicladia]KAG0100195.1 hypothetical protein BGZ93_003661 [Podila epicladia]
MAPTTRTFIATQAGDSRPDFVMADHCQDGDEQVTEVTIRFFHLTNAQARELFENFPNLETLRLEDVPYEINSSSIPPHENLRALVLVHSSTPRMMACALPSLETLVMKADSPHEIVAPTFKIDRRLLERFVMFSSHLKTVRLERIELQGKFFPMENLSVSKVYMTPGVTVESYFPKAKIYLLPE